MAQKEKKDKKKAKDADDVPEQRYLKDETLRAILAVAFFVLGIFFLLAAFGKGGKVGEVSYYVFHDTLFGVGFYLLPVLFFIL